ncbi:hypothetical protein SBOR_3935 [Sclerotinia borealis F-4128]|uniref:Uncharacterized protein n=1 Tax=Sclerotinia borealis (strain F-4128) TaxID=1432307 RepID=W9CLY2_SCLBF|nr:hypothetical protein SBOR_3935 [Sclerotinia borealis F-4128]
MNFNLAEVWGELLSSIANNEAVLRELLEGRPEIEKARDLNYIFMNYLSIIHKIFTIKVGGAWIDPRARIPSDLEFVEMLKLLVRYTHDITTWIEDHDRSGLPWKCIKEFYSGSLLEVDTQCQIWWTLADMTTLNQGTRPFSMPSPLSPTGIRPSQFDTHEAPPTPALSFTEYQSPSIASSKFSGPSTITSFNEDQIAVGMPSSWNDAGEPGFASHFNPLGGFDQRFLNNGGSQRGASIIQQSAATMPSTPRLEQQGFVPSPNPSLALQSSANKRNGYFQPMPPPVRKVAIPRLQKQGAFEPLLPPIQNSALRSSPAIEKASSCAPPKKRRYTKPSAETLIARQQKRQAVGSEKPKQNPVSTEYEVFTPGPASSPGTLGNDLCRGALEYSGESYRSDRSILPTFTSANTNRSPSMPNSNHNSNQGASTSHLHWDDAPSATFNSNQGIGNTGLGLSSPPMNRDFRNFEGLVPNLCMDMNMGHAGTCVIPQNTMHINSPMHYSKTSGGNFNGATQKIRQNMSNNAVKMGNVLGMEQIMGHNQLNSFTSWDKNLLEPRQVLENDFMDEDFGS